MKNNTPTRIAVCLRIAVASIVLPVISYAQSGAAQTSTAQSARSHDPTSATHASYEGFAEAIEDIDVATEEVGQLTDVSVTLGQLVQEGEVIARLDDRAQVAAVNVSAAQAKMEGEIRVAEASRAMQTYRVEQLQQLRRTKMAGPEELRRAEMELAVAEARLVMAGEEKELRRVEMKRLELQVELRKVRAPFTGVIAAKRLGSGDAVTPGNSAIVRLIRTDTLIGVFNVPAEHSFAMRPGMKVQVYFRAARETVDAAIDAVAPAINGESGTVLIRVKIKNPNNTLRVGDRLSMRVTPGQTVAPEEPRSSVSLRR